MNRHPRLVPPGLPGTLLAILILAAAVAPAPAVQKSEAELQMEFGVKVARKGAWNEAAFRFDKAVRADAANPRAWNNLGVALENTGRFDEARAAYQKALALAPEDQQIKANYERFTGFMASIRKVVDGS